MALSTFRALNEQLKEYTNELAYHLLGDPLVLTNLKEYLDISLENSLKVNLTTTANNLKKEMFDSLNHGALKQINFSLNSYNANSHKKSLDEYLDPIFAFLDYAIEKKQHFFINLRIWNLDSSASAYEFNKKIFEKVNLNYNTKIDIDEVYKNRPKSIKIARMIFFNFDDYFKWPDINDKVVGDRGFCYGLDSHFGVLASGKVVPCCLDEKGIVDLGDISKNSIKEILDSKRAKELKSGFKEFRVVEELCKRCEYRVRFDKDKGVD